SRHTIFSRDWSSDVCSSDLPPRDAAVFLGGNFSGEAMRRAATLLETVEPSGPVIAERATCDMLAFFTARPITCAGNILRPVELQIGRASCRGRVYVSMTHHS